MNHDVVTVCIFSLREGNVFTPVYQSVRAGASIPWCTGTLHNHLRKDQTKKVLNTHSPKDGLGTLD